MSGCAAFQSSTIFFVAATLGSWNARLWNVSVTGPSDCAGAGPVPAVAHPASSATAAAASPATRTLVLVVVM